MAQNIPRSWPNPSVTWGLRRKVQSQVPDQLSQHGTGGIGQFSDLDDAFLTLSWMQYWVELLMKENLYQPRNNIEHQYSLFVILWNSRQIFGRLPRWLCRLSRIYTSIWTRKRQWFVVLCGRCAWLGWYSPNYQLPSNTQFKKFLDWMEVRFSSLHARISFQVFCCYTKQWYPLASTPKPERRPPERTPMVVMYVPYRCFSVYMYSFRNHLDAASEQSTSASTSSRSWSKSTPTQA